VRSASFRERSALYLCFAGFVGAYYFGALLVGLTPRDQVMSTWRGSFLLTCVLGAGYALFAVMRTLFEMPPSYRELGSRLWKRLWSWETLERVAGVFFLAAGVNLMFDAFGAFKPAIPDFRPYTLDPLLADLDRALHLGRDPWLWLHAVPGRDLLTAYLDWAYVRWYDVVMVVLPAVLVAAPLEARIRFFLGYVLLWGVAGSLLAILLASGGPVYFAELAGDPDRYRPLLAYLDGAAPRARGLQSALWDAFVRPGENFIFEGISAMPSLHVGVAAYLSIWAWRAGWWIGALALLYGISMFVGSVHLGWHYAIDGYAGTAVAAGCWWACTRMRFTRLGEER